MPNPTHPLWRNDAAILKASQNAPALKKGAKGSGVERLREALETLGAEKLLEPRDTFGPLTEMLVLSFQYTYGLMQDGIAGASSIAKLDFLLNNPAQRKPLTRPVFGNAKGKAFLTKHLDLSVWWVQNAAWAAANTQAAVVANRPGNVTPAVALAYLLHFRLNVLDRAPSNKVGAIPEHLIGYATSAQLAIVAGTFKKLFDVLNKKRAACFAEAASGPGVAWCPEGGPITVLSSFGEPDRPKQSAAWLTTHELVHWVNGAKSHHKGGNNPYSHDPSYYLTGWPGCVHNPDCYAHFAAHLALGRPVLGEWWSACV